MMLRKKRYNRNGSNFFIMHLSMVELFYRSLVFPIIVIFAIPAIGITDIQCKAIAFFSKTCSTAIFGSLVAIAIDRYQNIVHPLQKLKSRRKPVLLVSLLWLCATVLSCPFVASVESISVLEIPEARGMSCNECAHQKICDIPQNVLGHSSTTLYFFCAFVVPLMIISVLYIKVAIFLHQRSNNGMMNRVAARSRTKAVRMLVLIVLGYVFSLGPSVFLAMLRSFGCKAIAFFSKTCSTAIFGSLVAIAIDRYQNIVHPLQKLKSRRKPILLVSLLCNWLCATILSCPICSQRGEHFTIHDSRGNILLFSFSNRKDSWQFKLIDKIIPSLFGMKSISLLEIPEARGMSCDECAHQKICDIPQNMLGQSSTTLYFLAEFFVPLMIISVLYIKVAIFLHQRSNNNSGMMNRVAAR
ncbi:unnamed protein product [Porites evermanni]|uniref:G-protein coupled receptors family 1 profile domain-containing protein n=1 Tax=Porites evermanni TaxID=104178 RepID=A0ABN8T1Z4_9CNID|nr:unnamed protein product [Porites evermanni]